MARQLDITLRELRQIRGRIDQQQLDEADWPLIGALVSKLIARAERQQERMQAKLDRLEEAEESTTDGEETVDTGAEPTGQALADGRTPGAAEDPKGPGRTPPATEPDTTHAAQPKKGHGRNGAAAFTNATHYFHTLVAGVLGAICKACGVGRMFRYREKVTIRIVGQPLFGAEAHHFEQARCRLCGAVVRADAHADCLDLALVGIGSSYITYDWSACAMLIVMHYFAGAPFKRLESLHQGWGVPMPDANQWRLVDESDDLLAPLYRAHERHGIQKATSLRIDDTGSMVIEIRRRIQQEVEALLLMGEPTGDVRTGINATGVYLETEEATVILFFTGRHHAGEIIDQLLEHRQASAAKLIKVTDAASKNFDHAHRDELVEAVCNAHAYLKFRGIKSQFPAEHAVAGEVYKAVFDNDDKAKALGLTPEERMLYHRTHSKPEMERLKKMCKEKLRSKLVEPNSLLWEPLCFIINQWPRLTMFYEVAGVPLDTNILEQTLIIPVRYLAGSFSYKTENGAEVGDRHMSLVATANANGVEPVAYLTHCLRNHEDLAKRPEHYLPWVYKKRLEDAAEHTKSSPSQTKRPPPSPGKERPHHPLVVPAALPIATRPSA